MATREIGINTTTKRRKIITRTQEKKTMSNPYQVFLHPENEKFLFQQCKTREEAEQKLSFMVNYLTFDRRSKPIEVQQELPFVEENEPEPEKEPMVLLPYGKEMSLSDFIKIFEDVKDKEFLTNEDLEEKLDLNPKVFSNLFRTKGLEECFSGKMHNRKICIDSLLNKLKKVKSDLNLKSCPEYYKVFLKNNYLVINSSKYSLDHLMKFLSERKTVTFKQMAKEFLKTEGYWNTFFKCLKFKVIDKKGIGNKHIYSSNEILQWLKSLTSKPVVYQ